MAGTFTMGARLTLQNMFSQPVSQAARSTQAFRGTVQSANQATRTWTDSAGRLRNEQGRLVGAARNAARATDQETASIKRMDNAAGLAKRGIQALIAGFGVKKAYDWLVKSNADMETYKNTLTTVMGSQKKAVETLTWAQKFAAQTPFEIPDIVEATTRMASYGINAQKTLGTVGDMASVMGKPLMSAVEAVADAQTGELERLKEFGITKGMLIKQAAALGTKPVNSKGQITDQVAFNAALFALMEKRFSGGMKLQSQTFTGMLSNAADFMGSMGRQLGKPIFDKAKEGLGLLLKYLNKVSASGKIEKWAANISIAVNKMIAFIAKGKPIFIAVFEYLRQILGTLNGKFNEFVTQNGGKMKEFLAGVTTNFNDLMSVVKPILDWIAKIGLPKAADGMASVGSGVLDVGNFVNKHWKGIAPLVAGITFAVEGWKIATEAVAVATELVTKVTMAMAFIKKIYATIELAIWGVRNATTAWEAAQWVLNVAMEANPIGTVLFFIGLFAGAAFLVAKNWTTVSAVLTNVWDKIKTVFATSINFVIRLINGLINKINIIPGIHIPNIPEIQISTRRNSANTDVADALAEKRASRIAANGVNPAGAVKNNVAGKTVKIDRMVDKIEVHAAPNMDEERLADKVVDKLSTNLKKAADKKGVGGKEGLL